MSGLLATKSRSLPLFRLQFVICDLFERASPPLPLELNTRVVHMDATYLSTSSRPPVHRGSAGLGWLSIVGSMANAAVLIAWTLLSGLSCCASGRGCRPFRSGTSARSAVPPSITVVVHLEFKKTAGTKLHADESISNANARPPGY